jgi:3-oxoacyl-[acyl-carrier-protein] synthase II
MEPALFSQGAVWMKRRAVITGLGIVSPIGVGVERFWASARAGRSGIGNPTLFDASKLPPECQIVGEVTDFNVKEWLPGAAGRMAGRFSQFAVAAAKMARDDAKLESAQIPPERILISLGSSMSGLVDVMEGMPRYLRGDVIPPWMVLEYPGHAAASHVAMEAKGQGQVAAFATACIAGLDSIAWAADKIQRGEAVAVVAGATETPLAPASLEAFRALGALSRWQGPPCEASRPFDRLRSGLVLAEGAAIAIVENEDDARARHAQIYARVLASASITEARHMREVDPSGESTARILKLCMDRADLRPQDIDYFCAHGNSLVDYDAAETAGFKTALGKQASCIPVSSVKSMCGQALAASSAIQTVVGCLAIRDHVVPPTINYEYPDPACDLDYVPNRSRAARVDTVLIHAQSIGGSHAALLLGRAD